MTDNQLLHKVNGIRRIKQAIANCDLPMTERGTMFSERDTHDPSLFTIKLNELLNVLYKR